MAPAVPRLRQNTLARRHKHPRLKRVHWGLALQDASRNLPDPERRLTSDLSAFTKIRAARDLTRRQLEDVETARNVRNVDEPVEASYQGGATVFDLTNAACLQPSRHWTMRTYVRHAGLPSQFTSIR